MDNGKATALISEIIYKESLAAAIEALVWTHADNCVALDNGEDPRKVDMVDQLRRMKKDLAF
jgi:hypothetical protein